MMYHTARKEFTPNKKISNHIFESSLTTFGTHYLLYDNNSSLNPEIEKPKRKEKLIFYSKWSIKPGHIHSVIAQLKAIKGRFPSAFKKYELIAGKGDLLVTHQITTGDVVTNDFPRFLFNYDGSCLRDHVLETYTTVAFSLSALDEELDLEEKNQTHYKIHDKLQKYTITAPRIEELKRKLKSLWIPKILSERIIRIIANYNNAILSPDMYVFYIEIFPFINKSFFSTVHLFYNHRKELNFKTSLLKDILEQSCNDLETSFENRFYQSYWTSEVPEANTDYSGGMHNLLGVYDSMYKGLNNLFWGDGNNTSFLYIKSENQVRTSFDTLKVNYLHLVQPYNFCSIGFHETLNYIFEKFYISFYKSDDQNVQSFIKLFLQLLNKSNIELAVPFADQDLGVVKFEKQLFNPQSGFVQYLKELKTELVHEVITDCIHAQSLRYFITDYLNLKYLFNGDFILFKKISWNNFFQTAYIYDSPQCINRHYFLTFSLRMLMVKYLNTCEDQVELLANNFKDIYPDDNLYIELLIQEFNPDLIRLLKHLSRKQMCWKDVL